MTLGLSGAALGAIAVGGATLASGYMASQSAADAAKIQAGASEAGIAEQRRQFNAIQELLAPYVQAGSGASGVQGSIQAQQELLGLSGPEAQQAAIQSIQNSPEFAALTQTGEEAILQNASATGGLRGGNVQGALAQFRPSLLSQLIQQRFNNLGSLSSLGQNAAAGVGNAGLQTGTNVANLLQQQGAAQAGGQLAQGQFAASVPSAIASGLGIYKGLGGTF